jgi:hypothetical protein
MISQTSSESAARGHKLDGSVDTGTASSSPSQNKLAYGESNDSTVRLVGGSLVLLVGGAILISVGWLLSLGVLQTLLWVLTAAMGFAAVSVAWNAFTPSSDPTRRTYLLIASASLAVVAFAAYWGLSQALVPSPRSSHLADTPEHGPGLSPSEPGISKEAIATQQNWMRMRQILVSLNGTSDFGEQRTLPGLISCLQRAQVAHSDAASEIAKLPIRDVDPEVVAFGASLIRLLNGSSAYFGRMRTIYSDRQRLEKYAVSPEAFIESALRGFAGDPLGKFDEIRATDQQLGAEFRESQREFRTLIAVGGELRAKELQLRAAMYAKYQLDLPAIE